MAKMSYNSIMAQYNKYILPANSPTSIRVRKVMNRLIFAAEHYNDPDTGTPENLFENMKGRNIPAEDWKIHVIDDIAMHQESPNAFVIGDGKVFVFRSILPLCKDDDGLATVLAHELGHQLADHIGEKLTKSPMYLSLVLLSYSLFGSNNLGNIAVSLGLERPSSRAMETEADYIGLMLMAHACFNPHEAPAFWSRMIEFEKKSGGSIPEFFSTHPSSERRNETLKELMPKAERSYELGGCGNFADRFRTFSLF
ncbi:DEKNAAC100765 [Brettanomyces naardenensis]|uniref:DEKNAAC100765 n=1 Tax=Brettanomyces naardenensis TaxID=13370 RepID=A0A448YFQ7_BRENA|nr:DEKNAAC100765 [Brettanomyces naardenensis]